MSIQQKTIASLAAKGIQLSYVKFQAPVAPSPKMEPVHEFKLVSTNQLGNKYVVQELVWTPEAICWRHNDVWQLTSSANFVQVL